MLIIGLSGKKQSGKNTAATHISRHWTVGHGFTVREYSYADKLKQHCIELFGLTHAQCYGTDDDKNSLTTISWRDCPVSCVGKAIAYCEGRDFMTAREVLQIYGTNLVRKMRGDAWVRATLLRICEERPDIALVTDVRFPNEVQGIQNLGGKVLRLTRNPRPGDTHESECALDTFSGFDAILDNSSMSVEQQRQPVIELVDHWLRK